MADKNNLPQASLLFSGSDNFSFPQLNTSATLVPVVGQEASMIPSEEEGEADSFLGQNNPPTSQPAPFTFFQQQSNGPDPFSQIGGDAPDPFAQISDQRQPPLIQEQQPELFAPSSQPTPPPPASQPYSPQQYYQPPPPSHTPQSQSFSSPPQSFPTPPPTFSTPSMTSAPPQDNVIRPTPQSPQYGESLPLGVPPPPTDSQLQSQWQQQGGSLSASSTGSSLVGTPGYDPVQPHWFFCKIVEGREVWLPFSLLDSLRLEEAFSTVQQDPENYIIPTNGGRYDVHLNERLRYSVFWEEDPSIVRRCTWFYKGDGDNKFVPYPEDFSERLESEYFNAVTNNAWHRRLEFPGGETIVMHNPNVIVHFRQTAQPDEWGTTPDGQMRPRVVKRGVDDVVEIEDGITGQIKKWRNLITDEGEVGPADHLVFVVHGIGPVCDLRFRSPVECVDDFRAVSQMLIHTHFKHGVDEGKVHRVEFLPVHWHKALHGDATGVDRQLKKITLPSIGRLRHFTNDTLLDILFYTSPSYCQTIAETVASEMDRLLNLFLARNPRFVGGVSVVGHSLGSLIVFDLLAHQGMSAGTPSTEEQTGPQTEPEPQEETQDEQQEETTEEQEESELSLEDLFNKLGLNEYKETFQQEKIDMESLVLCSEADLKEMGVPMGPRKKLFGFLKEQQTAQERKKREAEDRKRREAERVAQEAARKAAEEERQRQQQQQAAVGNGNVTSVHVDYDTGHTGIGMPHIRYPQLKFNLTNFFALGSPIGMFLVTRGIEEIGEDFTLPTCPNFFNIFHPFDPVAYRIEPIVNPTVDVKPVLIPHHKGRKRLHLELKESLSRMGTDLKRAIIGAAKKGWTSIHDFARAHSANEDVQADLDSMADNIVQEIKEEEERMQVSAAVENPPPEDVQIGKLNQGNRIDYVLQEKPIESFNEYLFALGSHVCYWESEDTVLLLMKEIYSTSGVLPMIPGSHDR